MLRCRPAVVEGYPLMLLVYAALQAGYAHPEDVMHLTFMVRTKTIFTQV